MSHAPHSSRTPQRRRGLAALVVALAFLGGGAALAASSIVPSSFSTQSGSVWQFIVDHSARKLNPTCYRGNAKGSESFSCLKAALQTTGIDKTLREAGPVTLFAPTDEGFAELATLMGPSAFRKLMAEPDKLTEMLHSMMVKGRYTSADLKARSVPATGRLTLTTLAGTQLLLTFGRFSTSAGRVEVRVGPTATRLAWMPYLVGQSTVLNNGALIPMDMVFLPASLR